MSAAGENEREPYNWRRQAAWLAGEYAAASAANLAANRAAEQTEPADDCAICVPGQCPGTDCPGNYASEPGSYTAGECTCTNGSAGCPVHDPI